MKNKMDRRVFLSKMFKTGIAVAAGTMIITTIGCENMFNDGIYSVNADKCDGCRDCLAACNFGAITFQNSKAVISSSNCVGCGKCPAYCDEGAISIS
ncbi:4Fe-4S dicluster domain-containing protein [Bacteroidales bacterium]|nr:4Fe-4S dicluster domain-containing protein [Bacteroidales bacterium]